jgi:hypothetical protein
MQSRLLVLQGPTLARDAAARVWACEQALRCAGVSAVLAWLPQVRPEQLRRLQMAAQNFQQAAVRDAPAGRAAGGLARRAAPGARSPARTSDALSVRLLKRRGPPLTTPLVLPARPERLQALLAACRQQATRRRQRAVGAAPAVVATQSAGPARAGLRESSFGRRGRPWPGSAVLAALASTRVPAGAAPSGGPGALDRLVAPAAH